MWQLFQELNFKFLELSVPWEKTSIFLVQWDLMFKQILVTKPRKNQALLSQSFKMLPELEKSDTWSSNGNNFKI